MANLWAFEIGQIALAGTLLGLSVHFKIYPFIYGASMLWALTPVLPGASISQQLRQLLNKSHITLLVTSLTTFTILNITMYSIYGSPFFEHTFLHHLTRIDHRHNFSPYNTLLYLSSSRQSTTVQVPLSSPPSSPHLSFERLAFLPQLLLSTVLIPFACARSNMKTSAATSSVASTLLAQTLTFVTFNKVCTSQYFLWYLIFLPLYLPHSSLISNSRLGFTALGLWIAGQALWLQQGFELEFLGRSTFAPGLWIAGLLFFGVNCWLLGIVVGDIVEGRMARETITNADVDLIESDGESKKQQ